METFYFTLGVLTIIAVILVAVVIIGMFKISKLGKELKRFEESSRWETENIYRIFRESEKDLNQTISNVQHEVGRLHQDNISYTDKRIDKVIYQYKENQS